MKYYRWMMQATWVVTFLPAITVGWHCMQEAERMNRWATCRKMLSRECLDAWGHRRRRQDRAWMAEKAHVLTWVIMSEVLWWKVSTAKPCLWPKLRCHPDIRLLSLRQPSLATPCLCHNLCWFYTNYMLHILLLVIRQLAKQSLCCTHNDRAYFSVIQLSSTSCYKA